MALLCGAIALVGFVAVFGGAAEDVTQHDGLALHDARNLRVFTGHRTEALVRVAKVVTDAGAGPVLVALAVIAGIMLWRRRLPRGLVLAPIVSLGLAALGVAILKGIVGRARPPVSLHLVSESDASFPSGHATDSAAVFVTIALVLGVFVFRRPIVRVLSVLGAGLLTGAIGVSRLVLGVHWPSDVLAGWALGVSVALAVTMTAALVARLTPPPTGEAIGGIRRLWLPLAQSLGVQRRARRDPQAERTAAIRSHSDEAACWS